MMRDAPRSRIHFRRAWALSVASTVQPADVSFWLAAFRVKEGDD
jgi:hypothetical protein